MIQVAGHPIAMLIHRVDDYFLFIRYYCVFGAQQVIVLTDGADIT